MTQRANFIAGRELEEVRQQNPGLGSLLGRLVRALNTMATSAGLSPIGKSDPPPTVGSVSVKAANGLAHVTIADDAPIQKPIEYFIEHDTSPNFPAPHVAHLVASRGAFLSLPSLTDAGAAQSWYFRAYSQYPGSHPSQPVYFGGISPTAVSVGGTVQLTPLASTGSGTASPTGGQGGWGRGKIPVRPPQGPKRGIS